MQATHKMHSPCPAGQIQDIFYLNITVAGFSMVFLSISKVLMLYNVFYLTEVMEMPHSSFKSVFLNAVPYYNV